MSENTEYQVLARKYRPKDFNGLIGQDALVRTLTNAIDNNRIAHAFMLTGVRGIGKTTSARIIAKSLNCIGADGNGSATANPCGICENCVSITEDRHVDVLEMDAASRTGVDDVREIIESVQYSPSSARYKIYIIDEVHMLSKNAFNALLKTLEEPPEHVKFIFATTEIRKVPITVLSRCQRFDLRRVDAELLTSYFKEIVAKEGGVAEDEAISLIAKAADGSVRDGLSILDQALSIENKNINQEQVRNMLGLADRTIILDLFETMVAGKAPETLAMVDEMYKSGADPIVILQDLMSLTNFLSKAKIVNNSSDDINLPEAERIRGKELSAKLSIPVLTRIWQILLKGSSEVGQAQIPIQALEMVLIRILYASDMPTPSELIKKLEGGNNGSANNVSSGNSAPSSNGSGATAISNQSINNNPNGSNIVALNAAVKPQEVIHEVITPEEIVIQDPSSFEEIYDLFVEKREAILSARIHSLVHPVSFKHGLIEIQLKEGADKSISGEITKKLNEWLDTKWTVVVNANADALPTLQEIDRAAEKKQMDKAIANPIVKQIMDSFQGAEIIDIRTRMSIDENGDKND